MKMYITGPGKIPSSATKGVKTKVEKKTLNPKWENQVLELEIEVYYYYYNYYYYYYYCYYYRYYYVNIYIPSSATKGVKTKVEKKNLIPRWDSQILELEIEVFFKFYSY